MDDGQAPRVGFLLSGTSTGGAERFLLRVIARLGEELQPVLFVRSLQKGDLHDEFVSRGAKVNYLQLGYFDPIGLYRFIRLLQSADLHSVVDFSGIFAGLPLWAARRAGIDRRIVFHRRSSYAFDPTWPSMLYARVSTRLTEHVATHILANSWAALAFFHPRLIDNDLRLQVIPNFIDPKDLKPSRTRAAVRAELRIPDDAFVLLHTGRFDPAKDHATLLKAAATAMAKEENIYCVVAGRNTEKLIANEMLRPSSTRSRFRFLGNRTDIQDLLNAADLFVFPSITEGQPNSLLEAMIAGLPVLTTRIPPIQAITPPEAHPTLIAPGDYKALSAAILRTKCDLAFRSRICFQDFAQRSTNPETIIPRLKAAFLDINDST